jgi:hypothetical protein
MNEIWKDIPDYEGMYQVSNLGNVKSLSRVVLRKGKYPFLSKEKILSGRIDSNGYYSLSLFKNKTRKFFKKHQLVAMAFLGHKPDGSTKIVVDHIDNNKLNNRLDNLQLISHRENVSKDKKGTSEYTGVCWNKKSNKWKAYIMLNKKQKYLGYFETEQDAHLAYKNALKQLT